MALNEELFVEIKGAGVIDVTVWQQKDSLTVHLVNLTNPMMMKGPFRELFPVSLSATINIPDSIKIAGVQLLVSGQKVPVKIEGNKLNVTINQIMDHEIIGIDLL